MTLAGRWTARDRAVRRPDRAPDRALRPRLRRISARRILRPADLESRDANLVGGALNGGTAALHQQLIFRPIPGLGRRETP